MNNKINIGSKPMVDTMIVNKDKDMIISIENTNASNTRSKLDILITNFSILLNKYCN